MLAYSPLTSSRFTTLEDKVLDLPWTSEQQILIIIQDPLLSEYSRTSFSAAKSFDSWPFDIWMKFTRFLCHVLANFSSSTYCKWKRCWNWLPDCYRHGDYSNLLTYFSCRCHLWGYSGISYRFSRFRIRILFLHLSLYLYPTSRFYLRWYNW